MMVGNVKITQARKLDVFFEMEEKKMITKSSLVSTFVIANVCEIKGKPSRTSQ